MTATGTIDVEVRNAVAYLTINNEPKRNAVNSRMCAQLAEAYDLINTSPEIRVGVITGAGPLAFSSGGYMKEYLEDGDLGASGAGITRAIPKPVGVSKIMIAAVNGYALAGGFGLALTCDLRIASTTARLGPSGIKRGAVPGAQQSQRLSRLVPVGKALEILLFSQWMTATEAADLGLVNRVVEPDELMPAAVEWAEYLAGMNPVAVDNTKRVVYEGLEKPYADAVRFETELFQESTRSEAARAGFADFVEGRSR